MRNTGWSLVVLVSVISVAQAQPELPDVPTSTPKPVKSPEAEKKLKEHLDAWEKAMEKMDNMRCEIRWEVVDPIFKKRKVFTGPLLFMKPNYFIFRLDYEGDPTKQDYVAYLCEGKSLYQYHGLEKTITEFRLAAPTEKKVSEDRLLTAKAQVKEWRLQIPDLDATDDYLTRLAIFFMKIPLHIIENAMFLSGVNPKELEERFEFRLIKEDANYVYLEMMPRKKRDAQRTLVALYGPSTQFPYFPCKILMVQPNGENETWAITGLQTNIPGIDEQAFRFVTVPGYRVINAMPAAPKIPDKPAPTKPESPVSESPASEDTNAPTLSAPAVECPCPTTCCYEKRFRWRLLRDCR
jgi:TIGR03009 family protein